MTRCLKVLTTLRAFNTWLGALEETNPGKIVGYNYLLVPLPRPS